MDSLRALERENRWWSLDEFVELVNRLSSRYLPPEEVGRGSVQQEVNARLVRHYTGIRLIDRPGRDGKESRYGFRHLLQMLVLRRLLLEGLTAQAISPITQERANAELAALLESGGQMTVEPVNPAVAYLQEIRRRSASGRQQRLGMPPPADPARFASHRPSLHSEPPIGGGSEGWKRLVLVPGMEVHIRDGFRWPKGSRERAQLIRHIVEILEDLMER